MPTIELTGTTALVTGASRGFGRAIAVALSQAGAGVVGVARDRARLDELHDRLGDTFTPVAADATDPAVAGRLLDRHRPRTLVLNAGASPPTRPLHEHTWETFSRTWEVDVRHAFGWTRAALLLPLAPGSVVVAGAKAAIRFLTAYAAGESDRAALGIRFVSVLPQLTPATELGAAAVAAYAAREGTDVATYLGRGGPVLTPEQVGKSIVELALDPAGDAGAYLLTAAGLGRVAA